MYAVTRDPPPRLPATTGVGGGLPRTIAQAGLVAVVSSVDLHEYGEQPLRQRLEDLAWLEETARAHHAVIEAVAQLGPVAPVRLATVYRDDARVEAMLAERRTELLAALDRIRGRVEFGVKAYAELAEPSERTTAAAAGNTSRPGTSYLMRRRADLSARDQDWQAAVNSAEQVHAALGRLADAARLHPPHHPRLSGRTEPMVLNGAYLVEVERADGFLTAVRDLAGRHPGIQVEVTGPWPPYSFAEVEEKTP